MACDWAPILFLSKSRQSMANENPTLENLVRSFISSIGSSDCEKYDNEYRRSLWELRNYMLTIDNQKHEVS